MTDQTDPTAIPSMFARPMPPGVTSNPPADPATKAEIEEAIVNNLAALRMHYEAIEHHTGRGALRLAQGARDMAEMCNAALNDRLDRWVIADEADKWQAEFDAGGAA